MSLKQRLELGPKYNINRLLQTLVLSTVKWTAVEGYWLTRFNLIQRLTISISQLLFCSSLDKTLVETLNSRKYDRLEACQAATRHCRRNGDVSRSGILLYNKTVLVKCYFRFTELDFSALHHSFKGWYKTGIVRCLLFQQCLEVFLLFTAIKCIFITYPFIGIQLG